MAYFDIQPFASTNPAVGQLFAAEFAQRQAQRQADQQAAANAIASQQIQAQRQLAQAQQQSTAQQQQYNNLFREREFQAREHGDEERNALFKRQLDIDEKWKVPRTDLEGERRKQAIIDANSNAVNDAQRANALYQINFDADLAAAKKDLGMFAGWFGKVSEADLDNPNHPARKVIQKKSFDAVQRQLLAEKGGALNALIPDAQTFTFKPVQYDETGKAIVVPVTAPGGPMSGSAADIGAAADLGMKRTPDAVAPIAKPADAGPWPWLAHVGIIPGPSAPANPAVLGAAPAAPAITSQPSVRRAFGNSTVLITAEDDATLARQLVAVPPEQRPAAYRAMVDQWLKAGRARLATAPAVPATPAYSLPDYNNFQ